VNATQGLKTIVGCHEKKHLRITKLKDDICEG
ncbi:hypothetical protein TNCT_718551, partial [Trichonephila clavata]